MWSQWGWVMKILASIRLRFWRIRWSDSALMPLPPSKMKNWSLGNSRVTQDVLPP